MVNIWTLYQAETCVVWSRFASFIEVGGRTGLGFRDTSQDVMSVVHTNPAKCRQRIVELLKAQVSQGYGLHLFDPDWFDPEKQKAPKFKSPTIAHAPNIKSMIHGIEHVCSDDALWIVVTTCEYVKETGDVALFDQVLPFADEGEATVYEHLKRSLDFSAEQVGQHRHLQGAASGLERLPESWRRRERNGVVHAPLGLARFCRGGAASWAATSDVEKYGALAEKVARRLRKRIVGWRVVSARPHRQGLEGRLA